MAGKFRKKRRLLWIAVPVLTAAAAAGIWFATRSGGEPVNVYPFQYIGMTEFWGDNQESYGPVKTDKIQTEFLSDTQTVTEVAVKEGDTVKKGDVLFSFDTTLDALSLERKRLEVEKIKVQIKAAEERLTEVLNMEPYVPADGTNPEEEKPDLGEELKDKLYKVSENTVYDGKTQETAMICWLRDDTALTDAILQDLYRTSLEYQQKNAEKAEQEETKTPDEKDPKASSASDVPEEIPQKQEKPSESGKQYSIPAEYWFNGENRVRDTVDVGKDPYKIVDAYTYQGKTYWLKSAKRLSDGLDLTAQNLTIDRYPQEDGQDRQQWEAAWGEGIAVEYVRSISFQAARMENGKLVPFEKDAALQAEVDSNVFLMVTPVMEHFSKEYDLECRLVPADGVLKADYEDGRLFITGQPDTVDTTPDTYTVKAVYTFEDNFEQTRAVEETFSFSLSVIPRDKTARGSFYVVFKTTQDNFQKGATVVWQGAKVTFCEDGSFDKLLYDASGFADHTLPPPEDIEIDLPVLEPGAMYTEEELLDMQKSLYATIKEQVEKQKLAESEYQIMERELGDGNVYAEIDGKVVSLLTEEDARSRQEPLVKVSGGGGFYIEGSVSELQKESLKLGQEVTVNDWNTGNTYTGEVISIGDFPSQDDNWNGMGNPTASYYPFRAFVSEEADLRAGNYVSMTYSASSAEQGIYLEKAFVRSDEEGSYIYVRGADGRLEKRIVRVGKVLWGSYYEILSNLEEEDYLAFPYGKNVKHGAPTVESDLSILYSY